MEGIIQLVAGLIIVILSLVLSNSRRRKAQQMDTQKKAGEGTLAESDGNAAPPPFMEDFPFATELEQMATQQDGDETDAMPAAAEEPEPPAPQEPTQPVEESRPQPPPVPVKSPVGIRSVPAISLLNLSPQTFRQGIVLKEILERPKFRQRRQRR